MDCVIRVMKTSDWESVDGIYKQGLIGGISTFQTESPSYEAWHQSHKEDCRLVAVVEGQVVGWSALSATSQRAVYQGVVEVSIYIDEAYKNKGIGTKLLRELCVQSEAHGYWSLYAAVLSVNSASIKLHKKCGFRVIGYREKIAKDRFGNWQDTTLLERRSMLH